MANRDEMQNGRSPFDEGWTIPNAIRSIALVGLLIVVFFLLSLVFPSPDRTIQTQLEPSRPFIRAE